MFMKGKFIVFLKRCSTVVQDSSLLNRRIKFVIQGAQSNLCSIVPGFPHCVKALRLVAPIQAPATRPRFVEL